MTGLLKKMKRPFWAGAALLMAGLVIVLCLSIPAQGQEPGKPGAGAEAGQEAAGGSEAGGPVLDINKNVYTYQRGTRRDPFRSLVQVDKTGEKKSRPNEKFLHPLRKYDISQMNLIAVISDPESSYAMIGLPNGKYFTVVKGTIMGLNDGRVVDINRDAVVVREVSKDVYGKTKTQDIVIRLREETQ